MTLGLSLTKELIVTYEKTASVYGSGTVEVFATPAMIAFMEHTAMESVLPFLPQGAVTVGTEVCIKHLKASPVGSKITCTATLTAVDNRKLQFDVKAYDGDDLIGEGTHERVIVDKQRFLEKIYAN